MDRETVSGIMLALLIFSLIGAYIIGVTAQETHDIAVVHGTLPHISVRLGELVNITAVVENQGTANETFDVTIYYDNTAIETQTVLNLAAGLNTSLTFIWDTASLSEDIYASPGHRKTFTLNAVASIVPGETETEDNTFWYHDVYVFAPHYLRVIPESTVDPTLTPGKNYTVSIYTDYNGSDIWGWQFSLTYNPLVLQGVSVTNGDLITTAKDSSAMFLPGAFNNTLGRLSLTLALFFYMAPDEPYVTSGPGILANITFTVVGTGDSDITLVENETKIIGYKDGQVYEIVSDWRPRIGHIISGYFKNTEEAVTHDVAVVSVTFSPTSVKQGEPVNITVVVENQGTVGEIFDVEVYYDYDPRFPGYRRIGKETVINLTPDVNKTLVFVWDTTDVPAGDYTITAVASELLGETDTEDNTLQSNETITVAQIQTIVYIRADGSVEPLTAPISTVDNVTYTFTDNNYGSIWIDRSNIIIDGDGYTLEGSGDIYAGIGFFLRNVNNITIKDTNIKSFSNGIVLDSASNTAISGNNITNNQHYGIELHQSSNNNLSGNNVTANDFFGILLHESFDNSISGNSITNNRYGVYIGFSSNNSLSENIMNGNRPNLFVEGDELGHFVHSIDVSNLVDGKPVYYLVDQKDLVINPATHPQVGYLGLINCANVTVEGLTLTDNGQVLLLAYTNNSRITNNKIANNYYAVELWYSSNNNISGNIITANEWWSIMVRGSVNNRIFENNISANFPGGILLGQSSNNYVSGNNITNNYMGLSISSSYSNSISRNNITDNYFGVILSSSSDNKFYHNNFINNTYHVDIFDSVNTWDNGVEGNYWSDYEEKYPDAQELDGSGVWNTPYDIDWNNQDNFPLIQLWSLKPSSPVEPTQELIETIETWNLPKGTGNSLKAKLKVAIHMLDLGKEDGAIRKLTAFINRVEMLREKTLKNEQADELVLEAQRIIDLING